LKRFVFDAGPFILLFTREQGSDLARRAVVQAERILTMIVRAVFGRNLA